MVTDTSPVLFAGDWHGTQAHARWTIDHAVTVGAKRIMQCGDFGYWEHTPEGVKYLDGLEKYARKRGVAVHFLDGNHDKTGLLLEKYHDRDGDGFVIVRPNVRYAPRGHRWTWGAVRFIALGGAYSVDKQWRLDQEARAATRIRQQNSHRPVTRLRSDDASGTLWFPEEEMSDADLDGFLADPSPVDVIVSHDKPRASEPGRNRKDLAACFPNQERIQRAAGVLRPSLIVHGHLHYRYTARIPIGDGLWCRVEGLDADPGSAYGARDDSVLAVAVTEPPALEVADAPGE